MCNHILSKNLNKIIFFTYLMHKPSATVKICITLTMLTRVHKHSQDTIPIRESDESKECLGTDEVV